MQWCPYCERTYDESEYTHCPWCRNMIYKLRFVIKSRHHKMNKRK